MLKRISIKKEKEKEKNIKLVIRHTLYKSTLYTIHEILSLKFKVYD